MDICIVGIGCPVPDFLEKLSGVFNAKIRYESIKIPKDAYDSERDQCSAEEILNDLKAKSFPADKVLGIIDVDIYVRGLNYVFGLSEIEGKNCIVSICRLRPEFYEEHNEKLFEERTIKESIHEVAHAFGLEHCKNKCVMQFSNSIEEVDRKPSEFCKECSKKLLQISAHIP